MFVQLQLLKQSLCKSDVNVVVKELNEGALFILFTALEIWHHVEVVTEKLAQVSEKVFVDNFVADLGGA